MCAASHLSATASRTCAQHSAEITCPVLLFWGLESWLPDPETDDRVAAIKNHRLVKVPGAGHWVHHDRLDLFLEESTRFLLEPE